MNFVETLFQDFEHTIAAASAAGTLGAVITSLWLAHKASSPKLHIYADTGWHIPPQAQATGKVDFELCSFVVTVDLTNQGSVPVYVNYWAFSWGSHSWVFPKALQQLPWRPDFRSQPIILQPGQSVAISLTNDIQGLHKQFDKLCELAKRPKVFRRLINFRVSTQSGHMFNAKLGRNLKAILRGQPEAMKP